MNRLLALTIAGGLAACTPAQNAAVVAKIETVAGQVQNACASALPLANMAIALPVVGPYIAAGVQVGCGSAAAIDRLAADPNSVMWLDQQAAMLRAALLRANVRA